MFFCRGQALFFREQRITGAEESISFNALTGLSCYDWYKRRWLSKSCFNALMGLSCYLSVHTLKWWSCVSMPSWAWVVTARMSNILNFSWYFLCIPAIYKCILAYLPIFFNQLSKFLRCESPSTFLRTCLSHHSFIIFLVTNTNTLFSGLYLISTYLGWKRKPGKDISNTLFSGLYLISTQQACRPWEWGNRIQYLILGLIPHFYSSFSHPITPGFSPNTLFSGLYLISTVPLQKPRFYAVFRACFCRYLSEYSDNSRFSCMLTFWTYLMRCTYPWH